jgi:hypothetical protein
LGTDIWCGVAFFEHLAQAKAAFESDEFDISVRTDPCERWQGLLLPVAHQGECNHLDVAAPGAMFEVAAEDPGGPLLVMTTAGFNLRSRSDFQRLVDFRRRVERMREVVAAADGSLAHQVFSPSIPGQDGVTMSIWRDDTSMLRFAYRQGQHRAEVDRQNSRRTVDRSSFTRFRVLRSSGQWNGVDPVTTASP